MRLLGRVPDDELPQLYGAADVYAMLCRNRWLGLEQEGFGIVFLEAAAAGVAQVAGRSGGADEAVVDGRTGLVVDRPGDVVVASRGARDRSSTTRRSGAGSVARLARRAEAEFSYDLLAGAARRGARRRRGLSGASAPRARPGATQAGARPVPRRSRVW